MSRPLAIILGVLTALPIAYIVIFVAFVLTLTPGVQPPPFPLGESVDWHIVAMILTTVLLLFYLVAALTLPHVRKRALWAIAFFLGSALVFPFFWYLYIWRTRVPDGP